MGGCAAPNCSNHSKDKFKMNRFPTNEYRRRIWAENCRKDGWVPGPRAELCCAHFEESQFEQHRIDNVKKLKPNAVPTLFDIPQSPVVFYGNRIKGKTLLNTELMVESSPVNHVKIRHTGSDGLKIYLNWLYWCVNIGVLIAILGITYVQQIEGFHLGYMIPAFLLTGATLVFWVSYPLYAYQLPSGSSISRIYYVIKEAWKSRHSITNGDARH